jgi:hypothetical protein
MDTPKTHNKNTYEKSNSIVLDLETLTKKYQTLLIEYQQAALNYINYVNEQAVDNSSTRSMMTIQGSAYWGTNGISQNISNSLSECKASCINTDGCTGATYNSTDYEQPMCWLRSGISKIAVGKDGDYAIVNKAQNLLSIVQDINEQLTDINEQILSKKKEGQPLYDSNLQESQVQNSDLIDKYNILIADRTKIAQLMNEYQTLDEQQNEGNVKISQNYYSYVLLFVFAIISIYFLVKYSSNQNLVRITSQTSGVSSSNPYYVVFGIIIIILIIHFLVNRYYY